MDKIKTDFNEFLNSNFRDKLKSHTLNNFSTELYISEGLIKSFEYDKLINLMEKLFKKYDISFNYLLDDYSLSIKMNRKDFNYCKDFLDKFEKLINVSGYHVSNTNIDDVLHIGMIDNKILYSNYSDITFMLNKKYDTEMNGIPVYLYHVTDEKTFDKINRTGLNPKTMNRIEKHPERVYLFTNIESAEYYCDELNNNFDIKDLIILKIDTRMVNKLILRHDPKFGGEKTDFGAVYTDNHFSPISIVDKIYKK
jgi:hypothetical protein